MSAEPPASVAAPDVLARRRTLLLLLAGTVCLLAPWLGKPPHIDDHLFLRMAEGLHRAPLDPYLGNVNWYGWSLPLSKVMENPPFMAVILSLIGLVSWAPPVVHLVLLLPALAFVVGVWRLASALTAWPALATAAAVCTPIWLVSASSMMSDATAAAFFVWSIVIFRDALAADERRGFIGAGVLASLAFLTKFPSLSLLPLLSAYALLRRGPRLGAWCWTVIVIVVVVVAHELWSQAMYGAPKLLAAFNYTREPGEPGSGGLAAALVILGGGSCGVAVLAAL
ncbi:MAG TPA: glycosyltransferase family 39 protein, partial [Myxococcota bacterium]